MTIKQLKKIVLKETLLSKNVFLLGHTNIDLDAFAAMAGFSLITKKFRKKTYLIIDDRDIESSTKEALLKVRKTLNIITSKEAYEKLNDKSLLVILDVNKAKLLSDSTIINKFNKITNNFTNLLVANYQENEELESLREFLLPLLMNGKITFKN